ncbi:MAG TPA: hypothetical protein VE377_18810 [Candidatus Dormibacteraeota bacterium]|nr:hypothetical protein [Candidatus Dormibacteraeota bacterium]
MRLSSVILARVLAYVEIVDLNPRGRVYYPDIARALAQRYSFQRYPQSADQLDLQKGVEFYEGKWKGVIIQNFTIFSTMLALETRCDTDDSKKILDDILAWCVEKFKLTYNPEMISRFGYVSSLTFYSDAPLLDGNAAMTNLAGRTAQLVSDIWKEPVEYSGVSIAVGHEPLSRKYPIARFTIQRRADTKFAENKYLSEAPLPTNAHLELLEMYERDIGGARSF